MRARPQKLRRLKFREFDARAREAMSTMLERLPAAAAPSSGRSGLAFSIGTLSISEVRSVAELLDAVEALLESAEALRSPLAFFALEEQADELRLVQAQTQAPNASDALPRWSESSLARVRRMGGGTYVLTRTAGQ